MLEMVTAPRGAPVPSAFEVTHPGTPTPFVAAVAGNWKVTPAGGAALSVMRSPELGTHAFRKPSLIAMAVPAVTPPVTALMIVAVVTFTVEMPAAIELITVTLVWPAVMALPVVERLALRLVRVVPATATRTPETLIDPAVQLAGTLTTNTPLALLDAVVLTVKLVMTQPTKAVPALMLTAVKADEIGTP
jgi:hypothetical protein